MFLAPALGQIEGVAQDAVDADAAHHGFLHDDLALGAGIHLAADRGIFALGVFAHDEEIDIAGLAAGERRWNARHQAHRPQVDILVELAAELQERAPERDMVRHGFRPADGAEEDRVVAADLRLPVLRHHPAMGGVVVAGGEVEMVEGEVDLELAGGRFEDAQTLGHHFLADAVAGDDRDLQTIGRHVGLPSFVVAEDGGDRRHPSPCRSWRCP